MYWRPKLWSTRQNCLKPCFFLLYLEFESLQRCSNEPRSSSKQGSGNSVDEVSLAYSPSQEGLEIFRKCASEPHPLWIIDSTLFKSRALRYTISVYPHLVWITYPHYPHV